MYQKDMAGACVRICILCGRDDIEKRAPALRDQEDESKDTVKDWFAPRYFAGTCALCQREVQIMNGVCLRCRRRTKEGRELITPVKIIKRRRRSKGDIA